METENDSRIPIITQYTYSLKIEDTSKGIRLTVHVWANSSELAVEQAFATYMDAKHHAIDAGIALAPIEITKENSK